MISLRFLSIAIYLSLFLCSCNESNRKKGKDGEIIYEVHENDVEMNSAIAKANSTLNEFIISLKSENENFQDFAIKIKVETEYGIEHIWISAITLEGDSLNGIVDNLPEYPSNLKLWDVVNVNPQDITDWMFTKQDTLVGGHTIRVLRDRMTEKEREAFDLENGLVII